MIKKIKTTKSMKKAIVLLFFVGSTFTVLGQETQQKIEKLIKELTLEEKASLCAGKDVWGTQEIERLNIPSIWLADGPHGVRRAPATDKWGYGDQHPSTCFPTASAMAASWDLDLMYKVGEALGEECQAQGVQVLLGPGVNIKRSVLGGRNFEYFSEDPILAGEMGAAYINGVQSQGVGTSLKHFAVNSVEYHRTYLNSDVDERTLRELYLVPFEIAVKKAQPWTVMASYNRVQGEYATQSYKLLTEILKEEFDYEGIVVSDWVSVVERVKGVQAGMHLQMPGSKAGITNQQIVAAVKEGSLDESVLNNVVKDILQIVFKADQARKENAPLLVEEHHSLAREAASQAITLLKNEDDVLPLSKKKYKSIAIIGEFAENPRYQGNGSSIVKPTHLDKALEIIKKEYGKGVKITYARGYSLEDDNDESYIAQAKKVAQEADVALIFVGLPTHFESEGYDRKHISLPHAHDQLVKEIAAVQNKSVVVLTNGSAVAMPWEPNVKGILETWLPGQAGAGAIADILFGTINPSGKLAETFPMRVEDTPAYINFLGDEGNTIYGERMFVGYRYAEKRNISPLYPFGFGLSYTSFDYSDINVSKKDFTDSENIEVTVKITNTGDRDGKEVVQLYVSPKHASVVRPEKELKAFKKIAVRKGETVEVKMHLSSRDFSYYDSKREMWVAESGKFEIKVGSSSADIRLSEMIQLNSEQKIPLAFDELTFFRDYWNEPQTRVMLEKVMPKFIAGLKPGDNTAGELTLGDFLMDMSIIKFVYLSDGELTEEEVKWLVEESKSLYQTNKNVIN